MLILVHSYKHSYSPYLSLIIDSIQYPHTEATILTLYSMLYDGISQAHWSILPAHEGLVDVHQLQHQSERYAINSTASTILLLFFLVVIDTVSMFK